MKTNTLGDRLRRQEVYHSLRVPLGVWTIVRVDGCGFSKLTASHFDKPFDSRFSDAMTCAARALLERLQGVYAYTESDEISLLLPPEWNLYDREVEKTVSLSAAIASASFTQASGVLGYFDSRISIAPRAKDVVDYFRWRQSVAARCALNGWCYWTLRQGGVSQSAATEKLKRCTNADKHELLYAHGINFADLPSWQRNGVGIYWETHEKTSHDPRDGRSVTALRRRLVVDRDLPIRSDYGEWLESLLAVGVAKL